MKYSIYYGTFEFVVDQNYQDILEFEFSKAFNKEYTPYTALLTEEQQEFVKDFEYKWLHNDVHEYDYYTTRNYDFLDFLKEKYEDDAEQAQYAEDEYDDPDEWWSDLDYTTKNEIMEEYSDY